ncbi:MAG: response regulator transcription factor [Vicingus serpentipes]|nr:response regulator transcription factor [Vicingus serpentipes]
MKILIVEDEYKLMQSILRYFRTEEYVCEEASNFSQALHKILFNEYDCVIIDLTLPDGTGFDIIQELKESKSNAGIIIISAKGSMEDKVKGLNLGSDDYIVKPFHLSELNARVKALYRRRNFEGSNIIELNEIYIDLNANQVFINKKKLTLTPKEYQLILFLISNKNKVITRTSLSEHLREEIEFTTYDFIYTHIGNLRKKLIDAGCTDYLKTIYGIGYKFEIS